LLSISLTAVGLIFVNSGPQAQQLQANFVDSLSRATGRAVLYDSLSQSFIGHRPAVIINNLKVPELIQMDHPYAITAEQVRFYLNPYRWARGSFDVQRIEVINPSVFITLDAPDQIALGVLANWAALFSQFPQIAIRDAHIVSQSRFRALGGALHTTVVARRRFGRYDIKGIAAYRNQRFNFTGSYALQNNSFQVNVLSPGTRIDISGRTSIADGLGVDISASGDSGLEMSGRAVVSHQGFTLRDFSYARQGSASISARSLTANNEGLSGDIRIDGYRQQALRVPTDINLNNLQFSGENVHMMDIVFDSISLTINQNEEVTTAQDLTFRIGDVVVSNGTYMLMDDTVSLKITDAVQGDDNRFMADVSKQGGVWDVTIAAGTFKPAMLGSITGTGMYTAKINAARNMIWDGGDFGPARVEYSHNNGVDSMHWMTSDNAKIAVDASGRISFDIKAPLKMTDDIAARFGLDALIGKAAKIDGTLKGEELNAVMQLDDQNKFLVMGNAGRETFSGQVSFIFAGALKTTCAASITNLTASFSNCMTENRTIVEAFELANKDLSVENIIKNIKP